MAAYPAPPSPEHKEAVRLAWKSMHIPVGTVVVGTLILTGIISMLSTIWSYGPAYPIP